MAVPFGFREKPLSIVEIIEAFEKGPMTKWTWYAMEFDGKDSFFGFVAGEYPELGYFSLSELENLEGLYGIGVERDRYFEPVRLSTIRAEHERGINPDTMVLRETA